MSRIKYYDKDASAWKYADVARESVTQEYVDQQITNLDASKIEYYRVDFANSFLTHGGIEVSYLDVQRAFEDSTVFLYLVEDGQAFLPYIDTVDNSITFSNTWAETEYHGVNELQNGYIKRIAINTDSLVSVTLTELQDKSHLAETYSDYDAVSTQLQVSHYPSVAVIKEVQRRLAEELSQLSESITEISEAVTEYSDVEKEQEVGFTTHDGKYINTNSGKVVLSANANRKVISCDVANGEKYRVKCSYFNTKYGIGYAIAKSDGTVLEEMYDPNISSWQYNKFFDVTIPTDGVKLYALWYSDTYNADIKKLVSAKEYQPKAYAKNEVYTKTETENIVNEAVGNAHKRLPCILVNFDAPNPCYTDGRHELCMKYGVPYTVNVTINANGSVSIPDGSANNHIGDMLKDGVDFAIYSKQWSDNEEYKFEDMTYLEDLKTYVRNAIASAETVGIFNPTAWFCRHMVTGTALNQALIDNGIKICRGNKAYVSPSESTRKMWSEEDYSRFDATKFNIPSIGCNVTSYGVGLIDYIDQAVEEGKDIAPFAHGVFDTEEEARTGTGTTREILEAVLSHIHDLVVQGKAEAVTFREYYEKLYPSDARLNNIARERKYSDWKYGQ